MHRYIITFVVSFSALLTVLIRPGAADALASAHHQSQLVMRTYTNARYGYTLRYPSDWNLLQGIPSTQLFGTHLGHIAPTTLLIGSLDQKAGVFVMAGSGTYGLAQIKQIEKELLLQDVTPLGKLHYTTFTINGVAFQEASLRAKSHGELQPEAVFAVVRRTYHYFIGTSVILGLPETNAERHLVQGIRDSFHLR